MIKAMLQKLRKRASKPSIEVKYSGTRTAKPSVLVSAYGNGVMMTVTAEDKTDQNEARATLFAQSLSKAMGARLIDNRRKT